MKLHRLVLVNYRGITHREIVFPDSGVIVISGANEIGKSSMIEAIDLLLEAKDRSSKKHVKQVKPTHADVGAEVTAEMSTGPFRFVYRKRFHKRCETELTVLEPRREQLTGDEAHERVCAMLASTMDAELWRAQRVLQSASIAPVDLSGCDALSRALDVAAGRSDEVPGPGCDRADGVLIDRVDEEYGRYFTATGRPTGEWAAAVNRMASADGDVARCAAAVAEVEQALSRHETLTVHLADLGEARDAVSARQDAARSAAAALAQITDKLSEAQLVAAAADAKLAAAEQARAERARMTADLEARSRGVVELEESLATAADEESTARLVSAAADEAAEESELAAGRAQSVVEELRRRVDLVSSREEAERLAARLTKIDAAERERDRTRRELAGIRLTAATMRAIDVAAAAVERAAMQADLVSARVELFAESDIVLRVNGCDVLLSAGDQWTATASEATRIELPGLISGRIVPGEAACDTRAVLDAAREHLAGLLDAAGVTDRAHAAAVHERRRELESTRERCTASLAGLCGDEPVSALRARVAVLRERLADSDVDGVDPSAARAELDTGLLALREADAARDTDRKVAAAAAAALSQWVTKATVLREKLTAARTERDNVLQRLAGQRAVSGDDEIALQAQHLNHQAELARAAVADLRRQLAERGADTVHRELADAQRQAEQIGRQYDQAAGDVRDLATQLRVFGTEGRKGKLDAAEAERAHAESEYRRVGRRARAARLLREVMVRHRDSARLRYVEPFRAELERLGRLVFGDTFEVDIDSDLRICSRTVSGRTVPYDSLSGGAKEQLGIIARLAGAALVAREDVVPVIIDDALGFADADRLARMGPVFDAVGGAGQVVVLTCSPHRFESVAGAHLIELGT